MENSKIKQLFLEKMDRPFDAINQIFFKDGTYEEISLNNDYKIKKFIGSDWSIKDSGFIFYCPNKFTVTLSLINIINN